MDERIARLAALLADNGVRYAFGVTGSGLSLHLISELEDRGVCYLPVAHEASAALMAGVVTRALNQLSVSISIKGPGFANMIPGIASNYLEGYPALSISEAYGSEVPYSRRHKRLDQKSMLGSMVKAISYLSDLDHLQSQIIEAPREIPGPFHMDLCNGTPFRRDCRPIGIQKEAGERILRRLERSKRPLLIIGSLASRSPWASHLQSLAVPVLTTVAAKGVVNESFGHAAGIFTGAGKELAPETILLREADLLVGIGLRNTEVLAASPPGPPVVLLDEVGSDLQEGFDAELFASGLDRKLIYEVLERVLTRSWGIALVEELKNRLVRSLMESDWLPANCFQTLNGCGFDHSLVLDTGSFCTVGEHLWLSSRERPFMGSSNGRFMGTGLPTAIALSISRYDQPVFCAVGDGGIRNYLAELKLAIERRLPICLVLMTDGRYGSIACVEQPRPISSQATSITSQSWVGPIEGMGCDARKVASTREFSSAVGSWGRSSPLFLEAAFDPEEYARMVDRLR